jgi:hypothetical protein
LANNENILAQYLADLRATNTAYTPLTEQQIAQKAQNRYQGIYDQNRLSAQQTYDAEKLARDQALQTQLDQYALQMDQSRRNYQQAQADAVRSALGRGMQRSSYIGATVGNIGVKGNEAQQAILKNQQGTVKNYAAQQQLAQTQLAQQLAQYDKAQLADQLAYQDELEDREYQRGQQAADRTAQLAGDIYNAQLYAMENNLFGYGLSPAVSGGSSGGGSYSSGGGTYNPKPTTNSTDDDFNTFMNDMGVGPTPSASSTPNSDLVKYYQNKRENLIGNTSYLNERYGNMSKY